MILLYVQNENPAANRLLDLYDDERLEHDTRYIQCIDSLEEYFRHQPGFDTGKKSILDMLREPAQKYPHSLAQQLEFIIQSWGIHLGSHLYRLLSALDLIQEEESRIAGPGPSEAPFETGIELDEENYSQDSSWMPELVLLAKSVYVWLYQLSQKYATTMASLDDIPDEELDDLARIGFTGLWLIGVWERSDASRRIKQYSGDEGATASAYSVYDYTVAKNLGGDEALDRFRDRCGIRGIRLAADVVPNHMGIDSRWIGEHPDWFLGLDYSPFPAYSFNGADLSTDPKYSVYLEDHYYERTDAAVVFKHVDHDTGVVRYIYHGNDGTMMPWNDTAQLNYLNPAVPEAMINTIINVARRFPIIRFDAAMTLTKRHYQRLWFPHPGEGGAIPTRAEHGLSHEEFSQRMPEEFWRMVVDRIAAEAPDTLLLAEAFWLTESYFVRTLGMHRVYNSAFMNMLRDEENARYRRVVIETLEYDPEILKRFVNFMNNPDEETAVVQFGKGDKYFGTCVLMVTMPGLPMFGHGQMEGLQEKYGVEFLRPRMNETADHGFWEHHWRVISPLLKRRRLFAGVDDFLFYDFRCDDGSVDDNVFAYSNADGIERSLVIFNNTYGHTSGSLDHSVPKLVRTQSGSRELKSNRLSEAYQLSADPAAYSIFRNVMTGLEHIYSNRELLHSGLRLELGPYGCMALLDHRQVYSSEHKRYDAVAAYLGTRGVPNIEEALSELPLIQIHESLHSIIDEAFLHEIVRNGDDSTCSTEFRSQFEERIEPLMAAIKDYIESNADCGAFITAAGQDFEYLLTHTDVRSSLLVSDDPAGADFHSRLLFWATGYTWVVLRRLGSLRVNESWWSVSRSWIDEFRLNKRIIQLFGTAGIAPVEGREIIDIVRILVSQQNRFGGDRAGEDPAKWLPVLFRDTAVTEYLRINRYHDILWFNKERFDSLLIWMGIVSLVHDRRLRWMEIERCISHIQSVAGVSGYRVVDFINSLEHEESTMERSDRGLTDSTIIDSKESL
jgi:glycosidase